MSRNSAPHSPNAIRQVVERLAHLGGDITRSDHSPLIIERTRTRGDDRAENRPTETGQWRGDFSRQDA